MVVNVASVFWLKIVEESFPDCQFLLICQIQCLKNDVSALDSVGDKSASGLLCEVPENESSKYKINQIFQTKIKATKIVDV